MEENNDKPRIKGKKMKKTIEITKFLIKLIGIILIMPLIIILTGIEEIIYKDKKERRKKGVGKGVKNETSNTL